MLDKTTVRQIAKRYTEEVCKILSPKTVILFGSYVTGNPMNSATLTLLLCLMAFKETGMIQPFYYSVYGAA